MNRYPPAAPAGMPMLPPGTFDATVVFVTGGGTGIGKAIAVEFARLGATIAVASRAPEHRATGVAAVRAVGGTAMDVDCDVRSAESVATAFEVVEREVGTVGVLVNNAAGNFPVLAEEMSPNAWRSVTGIVLDGTFLCSAEFARRAIAAERGGSILNIGATYSWTGGPGTSHSAAAKAAVWNLTMSLAVEWAPHGIRVNGLAPGRFPHDELPGSLQHDDSTLYKADNIPAGRVGELHELGWAATYMCSPYATYLSGHTMVLDGANWLRRGLRLPPFVPVAEQLGGG